MRNKNTIIILLSVFAVICLYNWFYIVKQFNMSGKLNQAETACLANKNDTTACKDYNELMRDSVFQNGYKKAVDRSFVLGLDLQGGMLATLEVGVEELIRQLAPNAVNDKDFNEAIARASKLKETSQESYVDLFLRALKEVNPNANLGTIFMNPDRNISVSTPREEIEKMLRDEAKAAIDRTFEVTRSRIDQFGVVSPNLHKQEGTGRIIVELPGVKEPERVRKLLRSTAKLEFWTCFTLEEAAKTIVDINEKVKTLEGVVKEDSTQKDSTATADKAKADSLKKVADKESASKDSAELANMSDEEKRKKFERENPFWAICFPPDFQNQTKESVKTPVVGYSLPKDTAKVNSYLRSEEVREVIPDDMHFFWTMKPLEGSKVHGLIAIRSEEMKPVLGGDKVVTARHNIDDKNRYVVDMSMNLDGAAEWARITEENVGKSIAVTLDRLVYSYPTVQGKIAGGRSQITGNFTLDEAKDLANILRAGQLPVPAKIMGEDLVGPTLGASNIQSGWVSFIIALGLVILFMVWYYRKAGVYATVALLFNLFALIGAAGAMNIVMTLPGIAGIVLTIGMAVDANVLVFERIREELRHGKTQKAAIKAGFSNAFSSIMDSNITTFLTGVMMFVFGVGPIKGFAVTLVIGIITSLISALFLTRMILEYFADKNIPISFGSGKTLGFFEGIDLKFNQRKKFFYRISGALTILSLIFIFTPGLGLKLGVDFKGGNQYVVEFNKSLNDSDLEKLRTDLTKTFDNEAPVIKTLSSASQVQITTSFKKTESKEGEASNDSTRILKAQEISNKMLLACGTTIPNSAPKIVSSSEVGPTVASDIKRAAFWSVLLSLIVIGLYILIRFYKWQYSVGAVVSLAHDVIVILGLFALFKHIPLPFNVEIDQAFIAAILTLIGYSINDTVVVFDRIRERFQENPKEKYETVFSTAINETLSRTLMTAGTTLLSVLVLLLFGGTVIKGFVFAIFLGVIFGTYSSIFIASAIAEDLFLREQAKAEAAKAAK